MEKKPNPLRKKRVTPYQRAGLWNWDHGITQSGLESFMSCREAFALGYIEGWAPKAFSVALEFGSMIHFMLEKINTDDPHNIAREVTTSYEKARKKTLQSTDTASLEQTLANAEAVFPLYVEYWAEEDAKLDWIEREKVFKFEHEFTFPFDDTYPFTQGGIQKKIQLTGMRDGGYRNELKQLGLFETKTKSNIDDLQVQDGLRADLQTCLYLLSLQRDYQEEPVEILYNIIRRPQLRIKKDEQVQTFKQRVIADIKERPEWYFRRFHVTVVPGDIQTFVDTTLDPVLRNMLQWWESIKTDPFSRWASPYHYRSLPALMTKYGKAWHYNLTVRGRKNEYYQKSSPFPELEDSPMKGN